MTAVAFASSGGWGVVSQGATPARVHAGGLDWESASQAASEYENMTEPCSEEDLDPSEDYRLDEEDLDAVEADGDNSDTAEQIYASGHEDTAIDDDEVQEIAAQIRRL